MPDPEHEHAQHGVVDLVDDAVDPDADAELAGTAFEFSRPVRPRIARQAVDRALEPATVTRGDRQERLASVPAQLNPIGHPPSLSPSP